MVVCTHHAVFIPATTLWLQWTRANALWAILLLMTSCQTSQQVLPRPVARLSEATVLPATFAPSLQTESEKLVVVPAGMLLVSTVARPRAQLRLGPGGHFQLAPQVLDNGTALMIVARLGVWRKVLVPGDWAQGWVHEATLAPPTPNEQPWQVAMEHLPTVLVTRAVAQVHDFKSLTAMPATVPRGALFRELRRSRRASLVWLPATNSAMWLPRRDVQ